MTTQMVVFELYTIDNQSVWQIMQKTIIKEFITLAFFNIESTNFSLLFSNKPQHIKRMRHEIFSNKQGKIKECFWLLSYSSIEKLKKLILFFKRHSGNLTNTSRACQGCS